MKKLLVIFMTLVSLAGCTSMTVERDKVVTHTPTQTHKMTYHFFLWGFANLPNTRNFQQVCAPDTWSTFKMRMRWQEAALTMLTLGIYTPYQVEVSCQKL